MIQLHASLNPDPREMGKWTKVSYVTDVYYTFFQIWTCSGKIELLNDSLTSARCWIGPNTIRISWLRSQMIRIVQRMANTMNRPVRSRKNMLYRTNNANKLRLLTFPPTNFCNFVGLCPIWLIVIIIIIINVLWVPGAVLLQHKTTLINLHEPAVHNVRWSNPISFHVRTQITKQKFKI